MVATPPITPRPQIQIMLQHSLLQVVKPVTPKLHGRQPRLTITQCIRLSVHMLWWRIIVHCVIRTGMQIHRIHVLVAIRAIIIRLQTLIMLQLNFRPLVQIVIHKLPGALLLLITTGNISRFIQGNIKENGIPVPIAIKILPILLFTPVQPPAIRRIQPTVNTMW